MWLQKGVIAKPETEIYYYLRGEKQARRRLGEKATLSSVLLELTREGIKLHKQDKIFPEGYLIENKRPRVSNLHTKPCPEITINRDDESYNIVEWIDDVERLKYSRPEREVQDEEKSLDHEVLFYEEGSAGLNINPDNLVPDESESKQQQAVQKKVPSKENAAKEEPICYINKTPTGNRMPDCTTIQHKMAAFQIETTTQQQRLIWIIRDSGLHLSDFLIKTGMSTQELLDVFLANVDSVSDEIMSKVCDGFKQYNQQWLINGSGYNPYNDLQSPTDNIIDYPEPPEGAFTPNNKKEKGSYTLKDFDLSIFYSKRTETEPNEADKSKESNNFLGGLVQGLLNHKQKEADLQAAMNEEERPPSIEDHEKEGRNEDKAPTNEQNDMHLEPVKSVQSPMDGIIEKYKPVFDGFIELIKPFIEPFINDLINTCSVQYPSMAEPLQNMAVRYHELLVINNKSSNRATEHNI